MLGWSLIMTRRVRGHAACMISAVVVSAVFLACYLVYHFEAGSVAFRGQGALKATYLSILLSHTLLATFGVVPLVSLTLIRAIRGNFQRHAAIARVTFPIWLYVSITGVIIYWMLYQMPIRASDRPEPLDEEPAMRTRRRRIGLALRPADPRDRGRGHRLPQLQGGRGQPGAATPSGWRTDTPIASCS